MQDFKQRIIFWSVIMVSPICLGGALRNRQLRAPPGYR
jgi:hypothetical protein